MLTELEKVAAVLGLAASDRVWREPAQRLEDLSEDVRQCLSVLDDEALSPAGRNFVRRVLRSVSDLSALSIDDCQARIERTADAVTARLLRGEDPGCEVEVAHRRRVDAPQRDLSVDVAVPIGDLKGVGPVTRDALLAAGVSTVADLLHYLPRQYQDRTQSTLISESEPGAYVVVAGEVTGTRGGRGRRTSFFELALSDGTGTMLATWFKPAPYLYKAFSKGDELALMGRVESKAPPLRMSHPEFERLDAEDGINRGLVIPVYSQPEGLGQKTLRKLVRRAFEDFARDVPDRVPAGVRERLGLPERAQALYALHFPESADDLPALREGRHPAHEALLWEDLFILQVGLLRRRERLRAAGCSASADSARGTGLREQAQGSLSFSLTGAQGRALTEIESDLRGSQPMQRLLQGDVGSGKTVVALLAAASIIDRGDQVAVLAPTEVLAFQWWERANALYEPLGFRVALLTGGQGLAARRYNRELTASGEARLIVGTHAVFQDAVSFACLGLAVVDEQQRFGVLQRASLLGKGPEPHLLAMTATPIPRSLALTIYGDLDSSVLDERPPRGDVTTQVVPGVRRAQAYALLRKAVEEGERAFVICSRVEGPGEGRACVDTAEELAEGFLAGLPLGVLHGRMDPAAKDRAVQRFRDGEIGVLVSTTVVEVGVDVPEATVMVVENADRFGLSQLHQLRGRIGRSERGGQCILLSDRPETERLQILEQCHDGFEISEQDLRLRGPGDLVGARQAGAPMPPTMPPPPPRAGAPAFRLSTTPRFVALLEDARVAAREVAERDDYREATELASLRLAVDARLADAGAIEAG